MTERLTASWLIFNVVLGVCRKVTQSHVTPHVFCFRFCSLYGIQFPVLCSRSLWVIHFIYSYVYMFIPVLMEAYSQRAQHTTGPGAQPGPALGYTERPQRGQLGCSLPTKRGAC